MTVGILRFRPGDSYVEVLRIFARGAEEHNDLSVLLTVDFLLCREGFHPALDRRWGGCDKKMGDKK